MKMGDYDYLDDMFASAYKQGGRGGGGGGWEVDISLSPEQRKSKRVDKVSEGVREGVCE